MSSPTYRLVRRARPPVVAPELDDAQRRVVAHEGGPLLVLAGPGTGKTTTIVEAVVDRIERRGLAPDDVLVLTFSRRAAAELRARIVTRLRRTTRAPLAFTFHGYAYALLRREHALAGEPPPRLLSGPEQLVEVRRLLEGEADDGAAGWPERLRPALRTHGFAEELRDLLLRARERGLDGPMLTALGRLRERDDWVAAGEFLRRYLARFAVDPVPAYDYAELIQAAAALLERGDVRRREQAARRVVFVDEYQDTDPAQEHLLHMLAGDGRDLVVVGDPDQSIYAFRGAEVRGILEFPHRFRASDGRAAPVVALRTCRRSGPGLLEATRRVAWRLPAVPGAGRHRGLVPLAEAPPGEVEVRVTGGTSQEAALVADVLRRAHLVDGVPWSRMGVLVRSAVRQLPVLRRALAAADVPVAVAGDELPLAAEPAVRAFVTLLRCALRRDILTEHAAEELLTGPFGGADTLAVRRLRRALGELEERAGGRRPSGALLVEALRDPR
ncbi:MAG: ATP-dependent helicase, partial [Streptosporangiaceae bacterium]